MARACDAICLKEIKEVIEEEQAGAAKQQNGTKRPGSRQSFPLRYEPEQAMYIN
jgi:hypothetical protein